MMTVFSYLLYKSIYYNKKLNTIRIIQGNDGAL